MAYGKECFPLWGGTATLLVTGPDQLNSARRAVDRVIADVDAACSTHRSDSELALVHAAGGRPIRVSATFHAVLWTALHAAEVTEGLVDPTACRAGADWRSIRVDEPAGTVALPDGATLDFGSIGKAFAADRAVELAAGEAECGVLFTLDGDIAVAGPVPDPGWLVRVADDHLDGEGRPPSGQDITLWVPGGLATTSLAAGTRSLPGSQIATHIMDPRSGLRVRGPWHSVSVAAGSCVEANTASTAAIIRGDDAPLWLASLGLPARLVHGDGRTTTVAGWPTDVDRPPERPSVRTAG
jgi:thiamine biosynthesis lipoprotein